MNDGSYWNRALRQRISRRRALVGTGGVALGSAFVLACGGDDEASSSGGTSGGGGGAATSGLLTQAEDSSDSAKQGGIWPHYTTNEARTMDPLANASIGSGINFQAWAYSRMFQWEPGKFGNPIGGAIVPDAAGSFEVSPDGLQITFKLRQDMKFDPRPPTNGRAVTTEDVEFSWKRHTELSLTRFDYVHELSEVGPINSIKAVDDTTVVVDMAFPVANMVSRFAFHRFLSILPMEADGGFDSQTDQRGSGPWRLKEWEPSVGYTYDRNPDWHMRPGQPYFDSVKLPLITEPAQRRAQLESGGIWTVDPRHIQAREILDAKKSQPKLNLYDFGYPWGGPAHIAFGFKEPSPFHDERIRRAVSMVLDRDLWIGANFDVSFFEGQGLPVETRWNTHYSADDPFYWLDPQGDDLGEGAAYFQYNIEEATKMMRAAGHDEPFQVKGLFRAPGNEQVTSLHGMMQDSGLFNVELQALERADWAANIWNNSGDFEGIAYGQNMGVRGDIDQYLSTRWSPGGASGTQSMFPEVYPWYEKAQSLLNAQRIESDSDKRLEQVHDLEREFAIQMPTVPYPGRASRFSVAWPQLGNFGVWFQPADAESVVWTRYWNDESKA